jgi:arsenate reductase
MAEAFLKKLGGGRFEVYSAGLQPGTLNPLAVEAMKETGIDISGNKTKSVDDFITMDAPFSYVITVCDDASAEQCPVFTGAAKKIHWSFPDPSKFIGTPMELKKQIREIRDSIKIRIEEFVRKAEGRG